MRWFKNIKIEMLSQENAETIANDWHYDGIYHFMIWSKILRILKKLPHLL